MVASKQMAPLPRRPRSFASAATLATLLAATLLLLSGCGLSTTPPPPTPADFQGIAAELVKRGIRIDHLVSGDAGCDDITLERTAIGLDAAGLDQESPTRLYVYIFRNRASFEKLRQSVDGCARSYATDPDAFESIEASPFVIGSAGPWAPDFKAAVRAAITEAAGTGD
jgi:hypothetical protein